MKLFGITRNLEILCTMINILNTAKSNFHDIRKIKVDACILDVILHFREEANLVNLSGGVQDLQITDVGGQV